MHGMFLGDSRRIDVRRQYVLVELRMCLGRTHALSNVNTPIGYADGLDESCRTRCLLVK